MNPDLKTIGNLKVKICKKDIGNIASLAVDDTTFSIVWKVEYTVGAGWVALSLNLPNPKIVEVDYRLDVSVSHYYFTGVEKDTLYNQVKIAKYLIERGLIKL